MKKAEEYLNTTDWCNKWCWTIEEEAVKAIKQAQIDAIEEAVNRCAKKAKLRTINSGHIDEFRDVDRPAILRLTKKLRKEIE